MGMFDSVYVKCPNCGEDIEFQSKAVECQCKSYNQNKVPTIIAFDLEGDVEICDHCGTEVEFYIPGSPTYIQCMGLELRGSEDSDDD